MYCRDKKEHEELVAAATKEAWEKVTKEIKENVVLEKAIHNLSQELYDTKKELHELRNIVKGMIEEPFRSTTSMALAGVYICNFCGKFGKLEHFDGCPYVKAKEMLGNE